MIESNGGMKIGHVVTWWKPAQFSNRAKLLEALSDVGLADLCPEARTPQAALRSALDEVFPSHDFRCEKLANRSAFEIIHITRGEDQNEYRHKFRVSIDEQRRVEVRPYDWDTADKIVTAFNQHLGLVTASAVTKALLAALSRLQGNRLRPDGGLYGLPEAQLEEWRPVARAVESAGARSHVTSVYTIRHDMDADSVRAVRDAIMHEIQDEAATIKKDIQTGELGERALNHRRGECDRLRSKIEVYEELLSCSLDSLRQAIQDADEAAVGAELLLSAIPAGV